LDILLGQIRETNHIQKNIGVLLDHQNNKLNRVNTKIENSNKDMEKLTKDMKKLID